jgi:cold shock CspA family protein
MSEVIELRDGEKHGVIVKWISQRGYGFVQGDCPSDPHLFLHVSVVKKTSGLDALSVGQKVFYEQGVRNGKACAVAVRLEPGAPVLPGSTDGSAALAAIKS